jgi:transglutaminase-like putative cysteine protease
MILEVQHETRLRYSSPVTETIAEMRMEPCTDYDQSCRSFALQVNPRTESFRYCDGLGNAIHYFNILEAHDEIRILAASIIETHPRSRAIDVCTAVYPLDLSEAGLEVLDFLKLRGPVRWSPRLAPLLETLRPTAGTPVAAWVHDVAEYIRTHFEYAPDVTLANSPIDDVLEQGKGVCQDFTHLMIAVLRSFGIPSRYVSGYIHRPNEHSQSHAWCEVWLPDLGWFGVDPTNDSPVNEHYVKVAIGRDFTEVSPNKGTYRGEANEEIFVRVETRTLTSLPSRAWQEQLPPLHVPFTCSVTPASRLPKTNAGLWNSDQ